ncbi:Heterogeneous nuclear ribonucleoprotein A1-like 2 [Thelohanellus kitauei]|uniref:Heterogeneous nuclear ribonucleoprotein A1-like 2 n=1 Tax=Thelohanellus kitauei TaxID=669202 RepID=A0A0C2N0C1_THEKT|nr:Heterogeneous nuclear ribonucleoprotein A1-like 2 [Thelohanellus kitauei]
MATTTTPNTNAVPHDTLCKIFVGNVSKNTTEEEFKSYFEKFGQMRDIVLMKDNVNPTQNRGFGFVTPELAEITDRIVMEEKHSLNGRDLDVKRALPKEIDDPLLHIKTPRIFLGGLPHNITEEELTDFFNEKYGYMGTVKEVIIKKDRLTGKPRGFCFVSFDNPHVVDKMMAEIRYPIIKNKRCEIKKADAGIPITGAPPSQIPKYPGKSNPRPRPRENRPPNTPPLQAPPPVQSVPQPSYDYSSYPTSSAGMMAYPQSNAYYSYYQNQASLGAQYQNPASYPPPYAYGDQRGTRPPYQRPQNYQQGNNRTRPY